MVKMSKAALAALKETSTIYGERNYETTRVLDKNVTFEESDVETNRIGQSVKINFPGEGDIYVPIIGTIEPGQVAKLVLQTAQRDDPKNGVFAGKTRKVLVA